MSWRSDCRNVQSPSGSGPLSTSLGVPAPGNPDVLIKRTLFPTVPPRVDYELTEVGRTLLVPVMALVTWANSNQENIRSARVRYDAS